MNLGAVSASGPACVLFYNLSSGGWDCENWPTFFFLKRVGGVRWRRWKTSETGNLRQHQTDARSLLLLFLSASASFHILLLRFYCRYLSLPFSMRFLSKHTLRGFNTHTRAKRENKTSITSSFSLLFLLFFKYIPVHFWIGPMTQMNHVARSNPGDGK